MKSKNNNISAMLIVCIVIKQSKTHNRILKILITVFTDLRVSQYEFDKLYHLSLPSLLLEFF